MSEDVWTEERVASLKKLWPQGLSATRIAHLLGGLTKNQVVGKVHRLGIAREAQAVRESISVAVKMRRRAERDEKAKARVEREAARAAKAEEKAAAKVVPIRPMAVNPFTGPSKLLEDLQNGECHWPINDPGAGRMDETRFCAAPDARLPVEGFPFCPFHLSHTFNPKARKPATEPRQRAFRCAS